ncbi:hypothetical protein [Nocardioides montaniterrae]
MHRLRWITAILLATGLLSVTATPATAEEAYYCSSTCVHTDARGDAPARADILRVRVANLDHGFSLRMRIRALPRSGHFVLGAGLAGWGWNYTVDHKPGSTVVRANAISEVDVYPKVRCRGAHVRWDRSTDVVTAFFPLCGGSKGDGSIVDGVDFRSGDAHDRSGKVFYKPLG